MKFDIVRIEIMKQKVIKYLNDRQLANEIKGDGFDNLPKTKVYLPIALYSMRIVFIQKFFFWTPYHLRYAKKKQPM